MVFHNERSPVSLMFLSERSVYTILEDLPCFLGSVYSCTFFPYGIDCSLYYELLSEMISGSSCVLGIELPL